MAIDTRDQEIAYAQKPNIVRPGSTAQISAAQEHASRIMELNYHASPQTRSRSGNVLTTTNLIVRET